MKSLFSVLILCCFCSISLIAQDENYDTDNSLFNLPFKYNISNKLKLGILCIGAYDSRGGQSGYDVYINNSFHNSLNLSFQYNILTVYTGLLIISVPDNKLNYYSSHQKNNYPAFQLGGKLTSPFEYARMKLFINYNYIYTNIQYYYYSRLNGYISTDKKWIEHTFGGGIDIRINEHLHTSLFYRGGYYLNLHENFVRVIGIGIEYIF